MTVTTTTTYNESAAGGTVYYFTFPVAADGWVKVYVGGVLQVAGYELELNEDQSSSPGGTVTFDTATSGTVRIQRETPLTQETDYEAYRAFSSAGHEAALDKLTMATQDVAAQLDDKALAADLEAEVALRAAGDATNAAAVVAEAAARQAADAAIIASGNEPANVGIAPVIAAGSTTVRTVADHVQKWNVIDFGADPTGVADSSDAINACILAGSGRAYLPFGTYALSKPINISSLDHIVGDGYGTKIVALPGFTGGALLQAVPPRPGFGASNTIKFARIAGLQLGASGAHSNVWGIDCNGTASGGAALQSTNNIFEDLIFYTRKGINSSVYTQECTFTRLWFVDETDQAMHLVGNQNFIDTFACIGPAGSTTDPLLLVQYHASVNGSFSADVFRNIHFECASAAGQMWMKFLGNVDMQAWHVVLENVWLEPWGVRPTYAIWMEQVLDYQINGISGPLGPSSGTLHSVASHGSIDALNLNAEYARITDWAVLDADSSLVVVDLYTRRGYGTPVDHRYAIERSHTFWNLGALVPQAGKSSVAEIDPQSDQNLLVNGSFEAGLYGWMLNYNSVPFSDSGVLPSEVAAGSMLRVTPQSADVKLHQSFVVRAEDVGKPFTFSIRAKVASGSGAVLLKINSPSAPYGDVIYAGTVVPDGEWYTMALTFFPTEAGTHNMGPHMANLTGGTIYFDEARLTRGHVARLSGFRSEQIELGNTSITRGSAAPAHGTWKRGDIVWNSAPSAGGVMGWMCVTAGVVAASAAWAPLTGYTGAADGSGSRVTNGGNDYACVQSGTSAGAGGPSGTGTGIVDGSCKWDYVGPTAVFKAMPNLAA